MTRSHDGAADTIVALTSVPPTVRDLAAQRACIRSWRAAGLRVKTFNHKTFVQLGARPGGDADFTAVLPDVTIHAFEPDGVDLDSYAAHRGLQTVDLVWDGFQGAAGRLIEGGRKTLAQTRYLYTRYANGEVSEGSLTLPRMLEMLPAFRVVEPWAESVLLENRSLA